MATNKGHCISDSTWAGFKTWQVMPGDQNSCKTGKFSGKTSAETAQTSSSKKTLVNPCQPCAAVVLDLEGRIYACPERSAVAKISSQRVPR
jgi:hypothetical protein